MRAGIATLDPMERTPGALAEWFRGSLDGDPGAGLAVGEIVSDSRRVREGGVFVALPGEHDDGHGHVREAADGGAVLAVVDRSWVAPVRRPDLLIRVDGTAAALRGACTRRLEAMGCRVVGITGSVGKTTVKEMCAHVLSGARRVAKTPGNMNTWTGVPLAVLNLRQPADIFIAELAMSARGEIRDLATFTRPRVGVVLNVGLAHVGLLGSIEEVAAAKRELLEAMPADGTAVLNADDSNVIAMASSAPALLRSAVWFGVENPDADFRATGIELLGFEGSTFVLHAPEGEARVRLGMAGAHAVRNACATAAVAAQFGVGVEQVADRLATFEVPERRGQVLTGASGVVVYDDCYNSSPTSLTAALQVLASSGAARRVAVVGDMLELGEHAIAEHRNAGHQVAAAATHLVAVGGHATTLADGALDAGMSPDNVVTAPDAERAAVLARDIAGGAGGAVLVKGSRAVGLERVVEALIR